MATQRKKLSKAEARAWAAFARAAKKVQQLTERRKARRGVGRA